METRSAKRRKLLEQQQCLPEGDHRNSIIPVKIDRISDLPDSILQDIFSLLPTKSVAQTSVLSKRFRYIWQSFPDLDFTTLPPLPDSKNNLTRRGSRKYPGSAKRRSLRTSSSYSWAKKQPELIANILSLREKNSDLRTLRFRSNHLTFTSLNALVRLALRLNVQELDMEIDMKDSFNLPRSISKSGSLRVLKFKSRSNGFRLPPTSVMSSGFKSLHTLSLSMVIFVGHSSVTSLFTDSAFPSLKKLSLDQCIGLGHLKIECRGIEELSLENCSLLAALEIRVARLEVLRVAECFSPYCTVEIVRIVAPRLRVMDWEYNALVKSCRIECEGSLEEASVGFFLLDSDDLSSQKICGVASLFSGLSCVRSLTLEQQCIEVLSVNHNHGLMLPDAFLNLKTLELQTDLNRNNVTGLARIFKSCPSIHTLIIKVSSGYKTNVRQWNGDWRNMSTTGDWVSKTQLQPFFSSLKVVKIHGVTECENEICLIRFLLKYGKALEKMSLFSLMCYSRREKIRSQLTRLTRASSNVKFEYEFEH